jgi:hypothetical protein
MKINDKVLKHSGFSLGVSWSIDDNRTVPS